MNDQGRFATAGEWLLRLQDDDLDQKEFSAWLQWHEADPLNRAAFEEAQAAFESANGLAIGERKVWAASLIQARDERIVGSKPVETGAPYWHWLAKIVSQIAQPRYAAALSLVALAAGVFGWQALISNDGAQTLTTTFHTPRATHRLERLPDGSTIQLGAKSSVSLSFSREVRYLVLENGEAFFSVAKDPTRPFIVQAGAVAVRAVGTEFNVRRVGDSTIVSVREGKVDILQGIPGIGANAGVKHAARSDSVRIGAGEQVAARGTEPALAIKVISPQAIATWQSGRLEFADEPLHQVVATVNRYSAREIVITDQTLAALRVTGTLSEDRIDEWLRALPTTFPIRVIEVSEQTVLLSPAAGG
jgi:transmembrane sensor